MKYVEQKFEEAVRILAVSAGTVRTRLLRAHEKCFYFLQGKNFEDCSDEIKEDWRWICEKLNQEKPEYKADGSIWKGSVEVTLGKIKNKTGSAIAKKIYDLRYKIKKYIESKKT